MLIDNGEAHGQKIDKVENKVRQDDVFILSPAHNGNLYFDNPLKDTKYFDNLDKKLCSGFREQNSVFYRFSSV